MTNPSSPPALAACPFCGGECNPTGFYGDGYTSPECYKCGATARDTKAWNRRTPAADASGLVEALEPFFDGRAVHGSLPVTDGEWTPVVTTTVTLTEFDAARAALAAWRKNHG